jgi:U3 small nucleolar RNA-associated protein 6
VTLWQQYLRIAQRAGARALAGRIAARAVQLHPRTPTLYVLAAAHELAHGGMSAARALLLRGLRLNAGCAELWREYVRLEMGFVEAVRRRWDVLGISLDDDEDDDEGGGQGERVDRAEEEAMGDMARRAIMGGAIVRQAIDSAAKGELCTFYAWSGGRGIFSTTNPLSFRWGGSHYFYLAHIVFLLKKN